MFGDDHFDTYVNTRFPVTDDVRRLANRSIDYGHYIQAGHAARGAAFRDSARTLVALYRRYAEAVAPRRPAGPSAEPQPATPVLAAPVRRRLISDTGATDQTAGSYSRAA